MTFDTYRDALLRIALEQGCSDAVMGPDAMIFVF